MSLLSASKIFLLGLITGKALAQTCESFGVDFQNGGSYFQNSLSTDPFTFVEEFDGMTLSPTLQILSHVMQAVKTITQTTSSWILMATSIIAHTRH